MIWFLKYTMSTFIALIEIVCFRQSPDVFPPGEYLAPFQPFCIDTLLTCSDIEESVKGWDFSQMGVDVRYLHGISEKTQITILTDSSLMVFCNRANFPLICCLENEPAAFSMSRSGRFALVYHQISMSDTARYLSTVKLRTGILSEYMIVQTSNFLQSMDYEGLVTDDGKLAFRHEYSGTSFTRYAKMNGIWTSGEAAETRYTMLFSSQVGNRILMAKDRPEPSDIFVLTTGLDTLMSFDPGVRFYEPLLGNDGETVFFSSNMGMSVFHRADGGIDSSLLEYNHTQPPVVSLADSYWACTFRHISDPGILGTSYVISGRVSDLDQHAILFDTDNDVRVLAVSDSGEVLCVLALDDSRFHLAYRYVLINNTGRLIWASKVMYPPFFSPQLTRNASIGNYECRSRLVDISPEGDRILIYQDGCVLEYDFSGGSM